MADRCWGQWYDRSRGGGDWWNHYCWERYWEERYGPRWQLLVDEVVPAAARGGPPTASGGGTLLGRTLWLELATTGG